VRALAVVGAALLLLATGCGSKKTTLTAPGAAAATPGIATVATSEGTFAIRLDAADSPNTVASFESLARKGFFDGTRFFRIVPGFVIQGGDPKNDGTGGPGYTTVDKPPATTRYLHGTVAMAKTQTDPAGTGGSQFFVVTGADAQLPPVYAVLGHVVSGLAVVDRIGALGNAITEQATKRVTIEHVMIKPS
jgi:cyclophilin family peptidyl-prolyl cis-trans isomerase